MKLLSDSQFDIKDYYGDLVILYPDEAAGIAENIKKMLDISGHVYHLLNLNSKVASNKNYATDTIRILDGCSCFVPIITKSVNDPKNTLLHSLMWHFIGYMRAKLNEGIIPFIPKLAA